MNSGMLWHNYTRQSRQLILYIFRNMLLFSVYLAFLQTRPLIPILSRRRIELNLSTAARSSPRRGRRGGRPRGYKQIIRTGSSTTKSAPEYWSFGSSVLRLTDRLCDTELRRRISNGVSSYGALSHVPPSPSPTLKCQIFL